MAWLQGNSTWGTIDIDLAKLLTGSMNDGVGANAGADAWVYDISSSYLTLKTPPATDLTLNPVGATLAGSFSLLSSNISSTGTSGLAANYGMTPYQTSCLVTAPISAASFSSTLHGRIAVLLQVYQPNTVAGNYSTARLYAYFYDPDNNWSNLSQSGNIYSPTAGGTITLPNGLSVTIADPSGFIPSTSYWCRGFTSTYVYGIDAWPFYARASGAPVYGTAPPGVAGTDYDLINQVVPVGSTNSTMNTYYPGGWFSGLGIKTATGLGSNALYSITSITGSQMKLAIVKNPTTAGELDLNFGPMPLDSINGSVPRPSASSTVTSWLRCVLTPTSVTSAMGIQYWICVKPKGIAIVLNADTGFSGRMGCAFVGAMDTTFDSMDVTPWYASQSPSDFTSGANSVQSQVIAYRSYFASRRSQDSSESPRTWQTHWMRTDFFTGYGFGWSLVMPGLASGSQNPNLGMPAWNVGFQPKPNFDGKWWLYGVTFTEGPGGSLPMALTNQNEYNGFVRGTSTSRWAMIPDGNWGNGDEIQDSVTGAKWFLIKPDYTGMPGRIYNGQSGSSTSGGIAIRENI